MRGAIGVIARHTWQMVWRDPLTRVEALMLGLLALLAAIAAIGSPTAGDGAIEMFGVTYAVVPFALVLVIGQVGRSPQQEVQWWSRPVSRDAVMWGRALGYALAGSALLLLIAAWGWLLMTVMAQLPGAAGAGWTAIFVVLAAPSIITITGASLWLQRAAGPAHGYFVPAILIALVVAFAEYKLPMFTARWPHLALYNPFPGFLQLGLSVPGRSARIGSWVWWNRGLYAFAGVALLSLAIKKPDPLYPLGQRSRAYLMLWLAGAGMAVCLVALAAHSWAIPARSTVNLMTDTLAGRSG